MLGLKANEEQAKGCRGLETNSMLLHLLLKRFDEFIIETAPNVQLAFLRGYGLATGV